MKRQMFLSLALAMISITTLVAQTKDEMKLPVKSGNEWQMPKDVLVRSHKFANHCQKLLNLDSAKTDVIFSLYLNNIKPVDEIRVSQKTEEERRAALTANQREFDEKVRQLITPGQYETYIKERRAGSLAGFFVKTGI